MKFNNRPETLPVHISSVGADSIVTMVGRYNSALRKGVKVTTETVMRMRNDTLLGRSTAHYNVTTPDSVVRIHTRGTRAQ